MLAPDHLHHRRQHVQRLGQQQGPFGSGVVHVGERVAALRDRPRRHVRARWIEHDHGPRGSTDLDRIDQDQGVGARHQVLHEVDPTDADLEHTDVVGDRVGDERLDHTDPEAVVGTQDVPEASDRDEHDPRVGVVDDVTDQIAALEADLARFPADRHPVQHALSQHHLGTVLAGAGHHERAEAALAAAVAGLDPRALPREHGVACNSLGALLRDTGRHDLAAELFRRAVAAFDVAAADQDEAAAWHNLGLCLRDGGELDAAENALRRACQAIDADRSPAAASAAERELGACLLTVDRLGEAVEHLERAVVLADRARDALALGAATNVLGLARLERGDVDGAADAFGRSAAAMPRTVQPAGHGMALANLALAHERAGRTSRARLAAAQALALPGLDAPVREQAHDVLERLGPATGDLVAVLDGEPPDHWPLLVRAEVARWTTLPDADRRAELQAWSRAQVDHGAAGVALAEALLGAYLEVAPDDLERLVDATVRAADDLPEEDRDRFRTQVSRAMARYPIPQWMRLSDRFTAHATDDAVWR